MALYLSLKRICIELPFKSQKIYHIKNFLLNYKPLLSSIGLQLKLYCTESNFQKSVRPLNILNYEAIYQSWGLNAIEDFNGKHSYSQLFTKSLFLKSKLATIFGTGEQRNVATILGSDASYVIAQWAIWGSSNVAVPLLPTYPVQQLEYLLKNSKTSMVITTKDYFQKFSSILSGLEVIVLEDHFVLPTSKISEGEQKEEVLSKEFCKSQINITQQDSIASNALIIYTSGTTGPPKGVVLSHKNLLVNVNSILNAWKISQQDVSLQCLPLNHIHGIVYALTSPLVCGARVIMEPKFDASKIWSRLINSSKAPDSQVSVLMAVPTMYVKLIEEYERTLSKDKNMIEVIKNNCQNIRLMVSGSASLPTPILEKWKEITGHTLVERYGMTEIGLALSNPLEGERKPGFVGTPLHKVAVRICEFSPNRDSFDILCEGGSNGTSIAEGYNGEPGELLIKGENVFSHYWENEEETRKSFTEDGWFITGDTAAYIDGNYKIVGRTSVDLIKSGGFKISALDIERCLMVHPNIVEVAVVGIPDITWGEKVAALIVWNGATPFNLQELRTWAKEVMPHHQVPSEVKLLDELPRNHLGKVNKKQLIRDYFAPKSS